MLLPSPRSLRRWLLSLAGLLTAIGVGVEVAYSALGARKLEPLVAFLSLSYERNLPTWYASALLLSCALVLAGIARVAGRPREQGWIHWWALALAFAYISLDESVGLHEHLGSLLSLSGVLFFTWVVPAAILVVLGGLAFLPFLARLAPRRRGQFILAGVLYVGGALLMELPLGWWTEQHGNDNLVYALIDHVEEALELVGASLFLAALVEELSERVEFAVRKEAAHGPGPTAPS
ncbi:hypothetical protein HUA74_24035 [Myxococcus sp. CA051A]|uniref:Uncharacterized protein n=1 Tax=Myxococcus llanfairpwllgwyngyllgogerychwyrndrobwllllantysiliogogogochensis TaxID=2590453 RepID=A0A540WVK2_9BACT|nr:MULTISPECIES: hypothetical protein [unclassified Myxococcus]NTX57257.1 hypothetical protein [Myxococcus sp. CA039A]NTX63731.1 hypothetical protein [Myxococcus sp. CA051A]TQF13043.1 hypothetical protein FJV41_26045 [Myxococcus llanfairpwllgwyngyllgogerychwyrndrobwllllantysiliogogogochensis]